MPGKSERLLAAMLVAAALLGARTAGAQPLVVIDPGHGGARAGATNIDGVPEKTIVLAVARYAKRALERGGVRVVMTRSSDHNQPLAARVQKANRLQASVFISVHANASPVRSRRGSETYVLSARASDSDAEALVQIENEDQAVLLDLGPKVAKGEAGDIDFLMRDLRRAHAHEGSARLASFVQAQVGSVPSCGPNRGLRQAPFAVLKGTTMPAILVEIGYVSHPVQGRRLATKGVQRRAAEAIARGVLRFLSSSKEWR